MLFASGDLAYARHRLHQEWSTTARSMWKWWGGGAAVNYLLVPTPWQPPFAAALAILWCGHVSERVHRPARGGPGDWRPTVGAYLREHRRLE